MIPSARVGARALTTLLPSLALAAAILSACDRAPDAGPRDSSASTAARSAELPDQPAPRFRNVDRPTAYVGDSACTGCHTAEAAAYAQHAMSQSFHRWSAAAHIEGPLAKPLRHAPTGYTYDVEQKDGRLYQVEFVAGPDGKRLNELRRRVDYVVGSGRVALTYFTEENGRLFQLPLTWYRAYGWDFSPGYQISNGRFGRLMPDACVACHSSYPKKIPYVEGKYAELHPGIGCERCHGPGALHVAERRASPARAGATSTAAGIDDGIVNPARLPLARRLETCEQCHVHTPVNVLREGKNAFSYLPSQPLRDQTAFFKVNGSIDIVSHADRLRQSRCFIASKATSRPLECATCHEPHSAPAPAATRSQPCLQCHTPAVLQQHFASSPSRASHSPSSDCVSCHMPRTDVKELLHGAFTDHWIRAVRPGTGRDTIHTVNGALLEPYFARDRSGPEARIYQGMGEIVYATIAGDARAMGDGAAVLDSALGPDTTRGDARFLLGVAYQQMGMTDQAIQALEQSVRADPAHPDRLRALAQAYDRAGRPVGDVDVLYKRALERAPALAWLRADYADFLQAHGSPEPAIAAYRLALAEQPSLDVAWFDLGTALAGTGRLDESSKAFHEAVHLNPLLAQALSPLIQLRANGSTVSEVAALSVPATMLPVREGGPGAVRIDVASLGGRGILFRDVAPRMTVQVFRPDGTLVRSLPAGEGGAVRWDLLSDTSRPVAAGLYRVQVRGRDASGRPLVPQILYIGVVHRSA
jgi:predicted CXXCH cytochrome family protein